MTRRRGIALIINNYEFPNGDFPGKGQDGLLLAKQFKKLDYKVILKRNLKTAKMLRVLKKVRKMASADHDSLIVVIGSHGDEMDCKAEKDIKDGKEKQQVIFGKDILKDKGFIELKRHVIDMFNNENCPKLSNAVKLFIIDCCRGPQEYRGFDMSRIGIRNRFLKAKPVAGNATETPVQKRVQMYTKTVVINAVKSGFSSRNIDNGSILMLAFEKCLQQYSATHSLDEINELLNLVVQQFAIEEKFRQLIQVKKLAKISDFRFEKPDSYVDDTDEDTDDDIESETDSDSDSESDSDETVDSDSDTESSSDSESSFDSEYSSDSDSDSDKY